jgi:hypothetical protein
MEDEVSLLREVRDPLVAKIVEFLVSIGLKVGLTSGLEYSFLPGIGLKTGALLIDESKLLYPGDLLHEAGHLALLPPGERAQATGDAGDDAGIEMGSIAWSYAAALHLGLAPEIVFHDAGYRGGSRAIVENFAAGCYFGVPILEWLGLTTTGKRAQELGVEAYPAMLGWLRE